jgi:hypothetical protein
MKVRKVILLADEIAQAFILDAQFLEGVPCALVLSDNILFC